MQNITKKSMNSKWIYHKIFNNSLVGVGEQQGKNTYIGSASVFGWKATSLRFKTWGRIRFTSRHWGITTIEGDITVSGKFCFACIGSWVHAVSSKTNRDLIVLFLLTPLTEKSHFVELYEYTENQFGYKSAEGEAGGRIQRFPSAAHSAGRGSGQPVCDSFFYDKGGQSFDAGG